MLIFVVVEVPRVSATGKARAFASRINDATRDARELCVVDPGYQPALFYVRPKCVYFHSPSDLPREGGTVLLRADEQRKLTKLGRVAHVLAEFKDPGGKDFLVVDLAAAGR